MSLPPTAPSPWLDDAEQQAWRAYLRMHGRLVGQLARRLQADSGLSLADYQVLVALTDVADARLRVLDLARSLDWEQSRMSHQVARMVRRATSWMPIQMVSASSASASRR